MTFTLRTVAEPAFAVLHSGLPTDEPVFEVVLDDAWRIAGEFIRWEWAVALFSALCGIEPFDQPNVAEAKAATEAILLNGAPESSPASIPVTSGGSDPVSIDALVPALSDLLTGASPGAYLAVLAYLPDDAALLAPLSDACAALAASRRIAVTLELGPRYLHSTGQYHKGGSPKGLFLVITAGGADDVRVPDKPYTLGVLNRAQAMGDLMTLASHGRPVIHVVLPDPGAVHIEAVAEALRAL